MMYRDLLPCDWCRGRFPALWALGDRQLCRKCWRHFRAQGRERRRGVRF